MSKNFSVPMRITYSGYAYIDDVEDADHAIIRLENWEFEFEHGNAEIIDFDYNPNYIKEEL